MHEIYKRPESVLVVVATQDGEVLLLRRRNPPDYWQSVTGSLGWQETAAAAARRELFEETGLDAEPEAADITNEYPVIPPWTEKFAPGVTHNREHVFRLILPDMPEIRLNPDEHAEYRWLPARDAAAMAGSETNRRAILELVSGSLKS